VANELSLDEGVSADAVILLKKTFEILNQNLNWEEGGKGKDEKEGLDP